MKFVLLCNHVFQMALKPGTSIRIQPLAEVAVGERIRVGVCEACANNLSSDLKKGNFRVQIVPSKNKKAKT